MPECCVSTIHRTPELFVVACDHSPPFKRRLQESSSSPHTPHCAHCVTLEQHKLALVMTPPIGRRKNITEIVSHKIIELFTTFIYRSILIEIYTFLFCAVARSIAQSLLALCTVHQCCCHGLGRRQACAKLGMLMIIRMCSAAGGPTAYDATNLLLT